MVRIEKDSFGEKDVPDDAYYGVHTLRSIENFQISKNKFQPEFITAIAKIKKACAKANLSLGLLEKLKAEAISNACDEIISGKFLF